MNDVARITQETLSRQDCSQAALARAIGREMAKYEVCVSRQAVNNWVSGRNNPTRLVLARLMESATTPVWLRQWAYACMQAMREGTEGQPTNPTQTEDRPKTEGD